MKMIESCRQGLWLLCAAFACLYSPASLAAGEQFYFIGMVAPLESISQQGGERAAYLRWDEVEGQLPADLEQIILQRDGEEIYTTAARPVLSPTEIKAFYAGDAQNRRRLEMISSLNQVASSQTPSRLIKQSNFANEIADKIQGDRFWASLASRFDFNVARARGRGFLDTTASSGFHRYELIGVSTNQEQIRLGLVELDTTVLDIVDPSPDFTQVQEFVRCDAPEYGKQHGVVALNWSHGGANATDRYINALMIAGFDIYRASDAGPVDTSMDIRQLAAGGSYDGKGVPILPGLIKLNEVPVMVGGSARRETSMQGWNPEFSKYLETYPEIKAAGLKPGDKRAYYLVARDITGNYGKTAAYEVEVPDRIAPPAPWDVHQITDLSASAGEQYRLRFSVVNVPNYVKDNAYGRRWCNLDRARLDKRVTFVAADQHCETALQREIDLGVQAYLVYRFAGIEQAKLFSDTDGDGYSDLDERVVNPDNPLLSTPGTACTVNGSGLGFENYLLATIPGSSGLAMEDGRLVIDFMDAEPARNRGQVFWYRFATRGLDGRVGHLSAPVRGLFPDRKRATIVSNGEGEGMIGVLECDYEIAPTIVESEPNLFARDLTGDARWMRMRCRDDKIDDEYGELTLAIRDLSSARGALLSPASCRQYIEDCSTSAQNKRTTVSYLDAHGDTLAEAERFLPPIDQCPPVYGSALTWATSVTPPAAGFPQDCKNPNVRPIEHGEILSVDDLFLNFPAAEADTCFTIFRDIFGKSYRIAQFCPPFNDTPELSLDGLAGGSVCLSVTFSNENNEHSVAYQVPCFTLEQSEAPDSPQISQLGFNAAELSLNFRPPEQPVAGTLFEWYHKGSNSGRSSLFKPHPGNSQADGSLDIFLPISVAPGAQDDWQQEWCVRGRSVGIEPLPGESGGNLSRWSPEVCAIRLPPAAGLPRYLPWPQIATPQKVDMLETLYLGYDGVPVIEMSAPLELGELNCATDNIPACQLGEEEACLSSVQNPQVLFCRERMCGELRSQMKGGLGFVVYRQTASDDAGVPSAVPGDFVQVSPLIDYMHCNEIEVSDRYYMTLADPYLSLIDFSTQALNDIRVYYTDKVPHVRLGWYRYQLVYFDRQGEILNYRETQWMQATQ